MTSIETKKVKINDDRTFYVWRSLCCRIADCLRSVRRRQRRKRHDTATLILYRCRLRKHVL